MRISDWSSDVCSSDLGWASATPTAPSTTPEPPACGLTWTTSGSVITFVITLKVPAMTSLKQNRIGNSVGVVLPMDVLARLRLGEGDAVYLTEDRKSTRLNSIHSCAPRMPSSAGTITQHR